MWEWQNICVVWASGGVMRDGYLRAFDDCLAWPVSCLSQACVAWSTIHMDILRTGIRLPSRLGWISRQLPSPHVVLNRNALNDGSLFKVDSKWGGFGLAAFDFRE